MSGYDRRRQTAAKSFGGDGCGRGTARGQSLRFEETATPKRPPGSKKCWAVCRDCRRLQLATKAEFKRKYPARCSSCGGVLDRTIHQHEQPVSRSGRKPKADLKSTCQAASAVAPEIAAAVAASGITIQVREVHGWGRPTLHWMFNAGARRVLDYWPGNGTVMALPADKKPGERRWFAVKARAVDAWHAVQMAAGIVAGTSISDALQQPPMNKPSVTQEPLS